MERQPTQSMEIDESLYSRQLYVMGKEAQLKMASSSVLIAGLNGLGVEVAKNVILAGVKSVALFDEKNTTWEDLSSQFYLNESVVGQNRAAVSVHHLAELNPYVHVSVANGSNLLDCVQSGKYTVVVIIDFPLSIQVEVTDFCHRNNIAVIVGDARGVCGQIFCDFGEKFVVQDTDGESAASSLIAGITRDAKGLVTCLEETRHHLNTGDVVVLSDIVGMDELNGVSCTVEVKDPFSFEINHDTSHFKPYGRGGYVNQVKQPKAISFQSFPSSFKQPGEFQGDFNKFMQFPVLHYCFYALHEYVKTHNSQFPLPRNQSSANEFYDLLKELNAQTSSESGLCLSEDELKENESFIKIFAMTCRGNLSPICAQLGGVLGQEVLKACSGKFMPIRQWFYYHAMEALPEDENFNEADFQPVQSRYDGQIMVFGREVQQRLSALRLFLVGAGAIGCEMLKNWAMMGIACDVPPSYQATAQNYVGQAIVTDMDSIEKSNLSRQFLFRNKDINKPKSTTAINAVSVMNPQFHGQALEHKVSQETETIFNDDFFESLDMVCTALDNVEARLYLDQKCLFYNKPMLESGTLGAKGHTQVVVPGKTENYGATRDPPEKSIPVCTLKHFPNQIEHTLQWGREWFEEVFKQLPDDVIEYTHNPDFLTKLENQPNIKLETLQRLKDSLIFSKPNSIADCVTWARKQFEDLYANRIKQLLHNFPLDRITSSGTPFWSGSKKPPTPLQFDPTDPLHAEFLVSVANMRATIYNLPTCQDTAYMLSVASQVAVEQFQPQEGVKIAATEEEVKEEKKRQESRLESASDLDRLCNSILQSLPTPQELQHAQVRLQSVDFDKDIDSHMHVVASSANLRARNYKIPEADLHTSRGIAGKITPAIATTTALVTGAICMEIYKLILNKKANQYLNTFTNLAVPLFTSMEPEPPKVTKSKIKGHEWKWTQVCNFISLFFFYEITFDLQS
jgi:ubiquitin-activating enzyme E1